MSKVKYVILNGPAGSGRSTIAREIQRELIAREPASIVVQESFAAPLKHFFSAALGEQYRSMLKERQRPELNGHTLDTSLRQVEAHCRDMFGSDCLGKWLVHRTLKHPHKLPSYVIVDDGGYPYDMNAVPNRFIVDVYRPGLHPTYVVDESAYDFRNDGGIMQLYAGVRLLIKEMQYAFGS